MVKLKLIKDEKKPEDKTKWKFVTLEKGSKEEGSFYIDGILKTNLDRIKQIVRRDWDALYVIDGVVGAGKSCFAMQLGYYLSDGDFVIDEVTFKPKEFKAQVLKSPKYNCVLMDESFRGMSSRAALSQTNKTLMSLLQEIRQRNLFILLCIPSIYDIDKYISMHRCAGLFHVTTEGHMRERGYWKFFNQQQVMRMVADQKWRYKYPFRSKIFGRFTKFYPIPKEIYEEKKMASLGDYEYEHNKKEDVDVRRLKEYNGQLLKIALENHTKQGLAEKLGRHRHTILELERRFGLRDSLDLKDQKEKNDNNIQST